MNRANFGKVSGVVIDVCRPHGAWFDRGELGAIRRFLRAGGVHRYHRRRSLEQEGSGGSTAGSPIPRSTSADDIYDVLIGDNLGWDVPSRIPRLPLAILLAAFGAWALWITFAGRHAWHGRRGAAGGAIIGIVSLYLAWRALREWSAKRG